MKTKPVKRVEAEKKPLILACDVLLVHIDGTILLTRRANGKKGAGKWQATLNGKVKEDEPVLRAIQREVVQKTGIRVLLSQFHLVEHMKVDSISLDLSRYVGIVLTDKLDVKLAPAETSDIKWVTIEEYRKMNPDDIFMPPSEEMLTAADMERQAELQMMDIRNENRKLIEKYPFLMPRNRLTGQAAGDDPEYDLSFTQMDSLPHGWRVAFGEQMMDELKEELLKEHSLHNFEIIQIKEKFGGLRFYSTYVNQKWEDEILPKYEQMSLRTCVCCGKPATKVSTGWISPFCDECAKNLMEESGTECVPWERVFGKDKKKG